MVSKRSRTIAVTASSRAWLRVDHALDGVRARAHRTWLPDSPRYDVDADQVRTSVVGERGRIGSRNSASGVASTIPKCVFIVGRPSASRYPAVVRRVVRRSCSCWAAAPGCVGGDRQSSSVGTPVEADPGLPSGRYIQGVDRARKKIGGRVGRDTEAKPALRDAPRGSSRVLADAAVKTNASSPPSAAASIPACRATDRRNARPRAPRSGPDSFELPHVVADAGQALQAALADRQVLDAATSIRVRPVG